MLKKITLFFFKRPDEIGLDNYLVLIYCFLAAMLSFASTIINIILGLGLISIISSLIPVLIFAPVYFYCWKSKEYVIARYVIILFSLLLLDFQWYVNYGSKGPIPYLFVILESFIILFFNRKWKFVLTSIVILNVSVLFYIEYRYPDIFGNYADNSKRLLDLYFGLILYLVMTILLLNIALKFYISQREKAEMADKLKSSFLANMSHEIRTPMNGILGFAEILKEPNLTGEQQQEYICIIEKSGKRMLSVINDIIDISKIESGLMILDIRTTDINEQIDYIYSFFKPETERKGLFLSARKSLSNERAIIRTDPEKLYAILINLVRNALKFTNKGTIELGYILKSSGESQVLEFFVKDTGIGIQRDKQEVIFERFIQADIADRQAYQGAGLGLSISKAYVEMMGGKIHVESEPEKGSAFFFTIPYKPEVPFIKDHTILAESGSQFRQKLKILIVEDDEASEMILSMEMKSYCSKILKAKTGPEAVDTCRLNQDIDLVLMDIQIPGIDGYAATLEIRKFNRNVIIIAETAYALTGDREKALLAGCNDYISKPINRESLRSMIRKYFYSEKHTEIRTHGTEAEII